ncbi:putative PKHD domain-containing transmembrane protein [Naja naja]|nr:putative PKHD domain-containing transmembrane protein [Naja naja]
MLGYLLSRSYLFSEDGVTEVLAHHGENIPNKFIEVPCSEDYDSHKRFEGCTPRKCGRGITDAIINREEAEQIRRIAERGLSLGGSDGGASILDLHSGALSLGKHFVNMYRYFNDKIHDIFTEEDFQLYRDVRLRIQQKIALTFGISSSSMYLTKPTFFSRINNSEAKTTHDEYWHPHIDKVTYGSFDYTSLLYLSDYAEDFGGGRFVFMDEGANRTVEPRAGCTPRKCGRGITDAIINREEAEQIRRYFNDKIHDIFTEEDFQLYRINNSEAKTTHDEYWHPHIDKVTYGSFDYTSLLYLSDYAEDFGGGRFVFMDEGANRTVEPRAGRVSFFTSGSENLHHVEKVHWGTRYAITISFTCNPDHGIRDPVTYGSFDYTSLLYLSDYAEDFGGGRFVFMDEGANRTVEPRAGRVSFFTSGSENLHHVEKVHWGTRYAITISFTCNPDHGIRDPVLT